MHIDTELNRLVATFVGELKALVQQATRDEVEYALRAALGKKPLHAAKTGARGLPGRRPGRPVNPNGERAAQIYDYIKANPGQRMELLAMGLALKSKMIKPYLKQMLTQNKIAAAGKARGTTYTAL